MSAKNKTSSTIKPFPYRVTQPCKLFILSYNMNYFIEYNSKKNWFIDLKNAYRIFWCLVWNKTISDVWKQFYINNQLHYFCVKQNCSKKTQILDDFLSIYTSKYATPTIHFQHFRWIQLTWEFTWPIFFCYIISVLFCTVQFDIIILTLSKTDKDIFWHSLW